MEFYGKLALLRMGASQEDPEMPDILSHYLQLERFEFKHLPWPGGMSDQPHQLMLELDATAEAVEIQRAQERQQAEQAQEAQDRLRQMAQVRQ